MPARSNNTCIIRHCNVGQRSSINVYDDGSSSFRTVPRAPTVINTLLRSLLPSCR